MPNAGDRLRIKENRPPTEPLPNDFEGTLVSESSAGEGTWLVLKDCSPGVAQRLVLREYCEVVELVEEGTG